MADKNSNSGDDWGRWAEWIKSNITDLKKDVDEIKKSIGDLYKLVTDVRIEQATQKVKTGIYGFIGSIIPVIGLALWEALKRRP